jgi:hypothetical protein
MNCCLQAFRKPAPVGYDERHDLLLCSTAGSGRLPLTDPFRGRMIYHSATKGQEMPLDMQQTRLADLASWSGITPIPNQVLEQHKIAEVAKRPGSWWYHHPKLASCAAQLGILIAVLGGMISLMCAAINIGEGHLLLAMTSVIVLAACITLGTVLTMRGIFTIAGMSIYGPAEWQEHTFDRVPYGLSVPEPIGKMARTILRSGNDLSVVYGKLVQNHVTVDPYLVIRRGDDQIVLGIWDADRIIHQATLTGDRHAT